MAHAHPTSLVAFSAVGRSLPLDQFPDLCRWIGRVAFSAYAMPGSRELGESLRAAFATGCDFGSLRPLSDATLAEICRAFGY